MQHFYTTLRCCLIQNKEKKLQRLRLRAGLYPNTDQEHPESGRREQNPQRDTDKGILSLKLVNMHSRSYLLLEREYQELQDAQLYGISVTPISDNLLQWIVRLRGLKDSLWEGAVLQLTMTYTEEYDHHPPQVMFNTIPFHPNVDQTSGKPCIDFLDDPGEWNRAYTMTYILLVIQAMLSNPVLENAVNPEAANMVFNKSALYRQIVLNCVKISRQIEDGSIQESMVMRRAPASTSAPRKIKCISFENYHKTWSEIATSKTVKHLKQKHTASLFVGFLVTLQSLPWRRRGRGVVRFADCQRVICWESLQIRNHKQRVILRRRRITLTI
ncbi:ubiquitin-conjugating enzyme E2 U isoform X2 [Eleutherodactylus coqui]|uniref:ubiquitin-conjugating enzyme E2 U isoform X2 n=1 Tax=Eleutherodactylus coqui TaxID=57060 RepID=UPI003462FC9C